MSSHDMLKDVPELFETALGESLVARTDQISQFRMGPPDLCHLVKTSPKNNKDVTSYHYVTGVEASSPGSLAAYINTLNYSMDSTNAANARASSWFTSASHYRIKSGVYCCYNAFSMYDVRVEVRIPGGVNVYGVNRSGKRVAIHPDSSPTFWAELFVSAVLRAILIDLPHIYPPGPQGLRRIDPLPELSIENRFIDAAREVFPRGWQLGPNPDAQVPSLTSNVLVYGLTRYFGVGANRWDVLTNLWKELASVDASITALLAETYIMSGEESKAVRLLHDSLMSHPNCTPLLLSQIDLLQKKDKHAMALTIAKRLVNSAPLEFKAWEKLTQCYTSVEDWPMSLLALNSCPMFAPPPREYPLMPEPARTHFPDTDGLEEFSDNDTQSLTVLRAEGLRGTFRRAYKLLARMVDKAGWEELLAHRAAVFVMEDEYRQVKEEELMPVPVDQPPADQRSTQSEYNSSQAASPMTKSPNLEISVDPVANQIAVEPLKTEKMIASPQENSNQAATERERAARAELWSSLKSTQVHQSHQHLGSSNKLLTAFSHKRLCERWLDDLFLMLYEDLRVYTAWKAEEAHAKEFQLAYKRTATEWEYLGDLARRLGKNVDARAAYMQCTELRLSPKAALRLLALQTEIDADADFSTLDPEAAARASMLATLNNIGRILTIPGHNPAVLYRVYGDLVYPNPLASAMLHLIGRHGLAKVQSEVLALNYPPPVFKRVTHFLEYAEKFHVRGWSI